MSWESLRRSFSNESEDTWKDHGPDYSRLMVEELAPKPTNNRPVDQERVNRNRIEGGKFMDGVENSTTQGGTPDRPWWE